MGRHSAQKSYGHTIRSFGDGSYRLYWTVDRYVKGSRLRFPTSYSKDTDRAGAERFAQRWGIGLPADKQAAAA